jgi:RHS repeat-associated protein
VDGGSTWNFTYNALGHRVQWAYSGAADQHLFDPEGTWLGNAGSYSLVTFGGRYFALYLGGNTLFNHVNALNSASMRTLQSGAEAEDILFYPWGDVWAVQGSGGYNFANIPYRDVTTTTDITTARFSSPNFGRWFSPDPIGKKAVKLDDPQTWNMYAYVRNNPTTLTDPTGLQNDASPDKTCSETDASCSQGVVPSAESPSKVGPGQNLPQGTTSNAAVAPAAVTLVGTVEKAVPSILAELPLAIAGGAVVGAAAALITNLTDTLVENYEGSEQLSAIESVVAVENVQKLSLAESNETAGGGPGAKKDNTLQGKIDRLKGLGDYNKGQSKKGGYRVGTGKSEQAVDHALDKIKSLADVEKAAEE